MHKSENEKIDFILDEHERIFRKQGSLCMALGKGFLVIAILCGVATFCVSGLRIFMKGDHSITSIEIG
ncbi:TPA: hypothetical protein ACQ8R0_004877 [Escherichia coli]